MSRSDSRSVSRDRRRDRKRSNSRSSRRSRSNSYRGGDKAETSEVRQPLEVENHQSNTNGNNHN